MGFAYYIMIKNYGVLEHTGFIYGLVIILTFTAGSAFLMWLGEQITEFGIGNGISIILFTASSPVCPPAVADSISGLIAGTLKWYVLLIVVICALALIAFIIFITNAERRIPVQYSKRVVGRKMYGRPEHPPAHQGQHERRHADHLCRLSSPPCPPPSLPSSPPKAGSFWEGFVNVFDGSGVVYCIIYFLLILFFSYFLRGDPV